MRREDKERIKKYTPKQKQYLNAYRKLYHKEPKEEWVKESTKKEYIEPQLKIKKKYESPKIKIRYVSNKRIIASILLPIIFLFGIGMSIGVFKSKVDEGTYAITPWEKFLGLAEIIEESGNDIKKSIENARNFAKSQEIEEQDLEYDPHTNPYAWVDTPLEWNNKKSETLYTTIFVFGEILIQPIKITFRLVKYLIN